MTISFWRLGSRSLWRDLRSGDLRLLMVAVTLAVAALTAVGFFADRLKGGLQRDALQLLGGDAVVSSDNPTPANFVAKARELGLSVVTNLGFPTMARATDEQGGAAKLVALKVVEPGYPLRGNLRVASAPGCSRHHHACHSCAWPSLGRRRPAGGPGSQDGRYAVVGRCASRAHRDRGGTRPGCWLHELRPARDDQYATLPPPS
jgi:hypothetical protein